tara:strand:+ start:274 stop:1008 length:735 start_codon:yes stop_codon:yes gene_type:complete
MKSYTKSLAVIFITSSMLLGAGCASVNTAIEKRNLQTSTQLSETIFLDPVGSAQKTLFIQIKNTSDQQGLSIEGDIKNIIAQKGYTILENPEDAHYLLQASILKSGKSTPQETAGYLGAGFGGAIIGGMAGAYSGSGRSAIGGGLIGAAVGVVGNALVKDVYYSMVTDIKISERTKTGVVVSSAETSTVSQGNSGTITQTTNETSDKKSWTTRIISTANKVNLEFEEAQPKLIEGLSQSIAGIF